MASLTCLDLGLSAGELNEAISTCETTYIAFVEDGAEYDSSYYERLVRGLEEHPDATFAKGVIFGGKERLSLDRWAKGEPALVDCSKDYLRALLYPCGVVFRLEALRSGGVLFDAELEFCRDEQFSLACSALFPTYCLNPGFSYVSPRVFDESSPRTPQSECLNWYDELVTKLPYSLGSALGMTDDCPAQGTGSARLTSDFPKQVQFGLLYLLVQRFKCNTGSNLKSFFGEVSVRDKFLSNAGSFMRLISNEVLFRHSVATKMPRRSFLYLASLRDSDIPLETEVKVKSAEGAKQGQGYLYVEEQAGVPKGEVLPVASFTEQRLSVISTHLTKTEKGKPAIEFICGFARIFPRESFDLFFCNTYARREHAVKMEPLDMVTARQSYFDRNVFSSHAYKVVVPLGPRLFAQRISAYAMIEGTRIEFLIHVRAVWQAKLQENEPLNTWSIPGFMVGHDKGVIHVTPANEKKKAKAELAYQSYLAGSEKAPEGVLSLRKEFFARKKEFEGRTIWAYYDKTFKAGDNGEHAYRYAMQQDDGIEKVFYINPKCEDAKRLKQAGFKVLSAGSMEGKLYALNADLVFMTHVPPFQKMGLKKSLLPYFAPLLKAKVIRLYHGFPNNQSATYAQCSADCSAVVVSSSYERDLYTSPDYGYRDNQIIASGNPRYDDLVDDSKRQILLAPTWRPALAGKVSGGKAKYNPQFKESLYFKLYDQIINDEKLLDTARRTGYKIKMFLHPKLSAQTVDFESNEIVESLSCVGDMDYVTIMRQSDLMVTDYSSVQYDFASMHKPVVYFHDPLLPYWRVVDFDYAKYGFGEICHSVDQLVETLCSYMERDCAMSEHYNQRIDDFFINNDHHASQRLYEAALKL